jgi:hypothetical protein
VICLLAASVLIDFAHMVLSMIIDSVLAAQHPSVFAVQRGGSGAVLSMRRAMHLRPLVKNEVFDRASFFG